VSAGVQRIRAALNDLKEGICSIYVWPMLGWLEIKQRYRRSVLGPFWLTISTGVMIGGMGPLYGRLLDQDTSAYFPYLAVSFVVWMLLANLITDACTAFISAEGFIKQIKLPFTVYILRVVWKNLIIFGHNLLIVIVVLVFFRPSLGWYLLLVPLSVMLISINGIWIGILLGLLCARFRDIPQIIGSLVQIAFFLTPVMWKATMLGQHQWAANFNPLFHFLEIVRAPLMNSDPALVSWLVAIGITVVGFTVALAMFSRFRARIAYWV